MLPHRRLGVGAVADGFRRQGHHHRPALRDADDFFFENPQFRRVDQIIREINSQEWGLDLAEAWTGVVVPGTFHRIKEVVGVGSLERRG